MYLTQGSFCWSSLINGGTWYIWIIHVAWRWDGVGGLTRFLFHISASFHSTPARQLDGVNLQGFYVWKLQDRHVPQFGFFTSTYHQSKAKASIAVYREIIAHGGFPADNTTQTCRSRELSEPCSACEWIFKNKVMLVFGGCLLITAVMSAALVISVITTKRKQTRGRRRGVNRMNRRRGREGVSVCLCPPITCELQR